MSGQLSEQIEILANALRVTEDHWDALSILDGLRSAYLLDGNDEQAEIAATDIVSRAAIFVRESKWTNEQKSSVLDKMFDAYVTLAPNDFHSFLMALEWDRDPKERFYQPRLSILRSVADDLTDMMVYDLYDIMMLSMPPGTGKSTLGLFFLMWVIGRQPDKCNLAIGYSTPMAKSFYDRIGSIDESLDYNYHKIFPKLTRVYTSAKELEYDFSNDPSDVKKPFSSLTCASVGGSLTGRTRCENLLYCDDMVEGAETAMSPTRLEKLWELYNSNARSRKKEGCKELHIGTRWSLKDPIGRLMAIYGDKPRCKIVSLPAMDESDESNFDYGYGVGFSTEMYRDLRLTLSTIAWNALYQQQPIEAEGLLFPVDKLRRFSIGDIDFEHNPPDDVFAFCDVAFGGNDYLSMPIMAQWGTDPPIVVDVVFMKGSYERTQPVVVGKIAQWGIMRAVFESNNGGDFYAEDIKREIKSQGIQCHVTTQRAGTRMSKEARIVQHSPAILQFKFLKPDDYPADGMYRDFIQNMITYSADGKSEHDDAPDSCAGVASIMRTNTRAKIKVLARRFM